MKPRMSVKTLFATLLLALAPMAQADSYTQARYPIVLVHGLFGFDQLGGAINYFYRVPQGLQSGGARVFTPAVSPVDSTEVRGEQLLAQVKTILAVTGARKVSLIGHSHGGPTARYVAGVIPAQVASVTTIAGVQKGTRIADLVLALENFGLTRPLIDSVFGAVAGLVGVASGNPFDTRTLASMTSISTPGSLAFNTRFPAGVPASACGEGAYSGNGGQLFYSWTGTGQLTNPLDPLDGPLGLASVVFLGLENDTLIDKCSTHFGRVLRNNYPWNHLDEVNQVLGLRGLFTPDPISVFRAHANRLKLAGL